MLIAIGNKGILHYVRTINYKTLHISIPVSLPNRFQINVKESVILSLLLSLFVKYLFKNIQGFAQKLI